MRHLINSLLLLAAIVFVAFAAACGRSSGAAIAGVSPVRSVTITQRASVSPSAPATATAQPSATAKPPASSGAASPVPASRTAATPTPTGSAAPSSGFSAADIWPLVIIGAIVIIAVVVWVFRAEGRRGAAAAAWRSRVTDAYAGGAALYDAMSVAERPAALAAQDAGLRWSDIQRRADDFTQMLYALREAAPDENSRSRVTDVLASLQAVRSAMDAERAPGGAGARQAEHVRGRLFSFEAALRALRASDQLMA
jgi:hypothetical protein